MIEPRALKRRHHGRGGTRLGRLERGRRARFIVVLDESDQPLLVVRIGLEVPTDRVGRVVDEAVVQALVVAEVEALLLQRPFHVPVRLGHEQKLGMRRLHARDQLRPVVGLGRGPGPLSPRPGEDLVGHQHRHVASKPVALRADRDQRLGHGVAQLGRESVQLHDVRPGREVRIATVGEDAAGGAEEGLGVLGELLVAAGEQAAGPGGDPRMVGRHVVRDVVEDQRQATAGERLARGRERVRPAEASVDDVVAHAIRRADHVLRSQIRQGGAIAAVELRVAPGDLDPGGAALPDTHQPHRIDRQRGERVPLCPGTSSRVSGRPRARPSRSSQTAVLSS